MRFILFTLLSTITSLTFGQKENWITPFVKNDAFKYGEKLNYKINYSLYLNIPVVNLDMEIKEHPRVLKNRNHYHILAKANSYKYADAFFPVDDKFESYVDAKTFTPSYSVNKYHEGKYRSTKYYIMRHQKGLLKNHEGKVSKIPYLTQDILSCLYLARTFDLTEAQPGDSFMLNLYLDDSLFYVGFIYEGKEKIKVKRNHYNTIRVRPIIIVDRVFKSEEDMRMWVSDDQNKVPIKISSGIKVGAVTCILDEYSGLRYKLNTAN